ncbi:MAG: hypothetical protein U0610_04330 [bacterium]
MLGAIQPIFDALHGPDGFCTEAGNELAPPGTRKATPATVLARIEQLAQSSSSSTKPSPRSSSSANAS